MCKKIFLLSILLLSSMMMIFSCCEAEKEEPENKPAPASPQTPVIATESETLIYKINEQPRDLTIVATVTDGGVLSYQWYKSDTADGEYTVIKNALEKDYLPDTSEVGTTHYKCTVTNTLNGKTASETSPVLTVIVNENEVISDEPQKPVIATEIEALIYKLNEQAKKLTIVAVVADGGTLSYQWYKSDLLEGEYTPIADALTSNYTPDTSKLGTTYYKCTVTNTLNGKTASETSPVLTVAVNKNEVISDEPQKPVIAIVNKELTCKINEQAKKLTIVAVVADDGELSYQWYKSDLLDGEYTPIADALTSNYTPDTWKLGITYYKCTVTNTLNGKTASETSPVFTVEVVKDNVVIPEISEIFSYKVGQDAEKLKVSAKVTDGGVLSYQWYKAAADESKFTLVTDVTGNEYTPDTSKAGTTYYKCTVTNTLNGMSASADTPIFTVIVTEVGNAMPPKIMANTSYKVQIKEETILKVEATSGDEGKLSYQWSSSTDNTNFSDLPGKNGAVLTVTPTEIGTVYYKCKVTNTVKISGIEKTATSEVVITVEVETVNGNINIDFN